MQNILIVHLWLAIVSWCVFLNGHALAGMMIISIGTLCLYRRIASPDYRNILLSFLFLNGAGALLSYQESIARFFSGIQLFECLMMINASLLGCLCDRLRREDLKALVCFSFFAMIAMSAAICLVKDIDYTLFTKMNLYRMEALIFFPHVFSLVRSYLFRDVRIRLRQVHKEKTLV